MYVCTHYVLIHNSTYLYKTVHTYVFSYVCMHTYVYMYVHTYIYVCMYLSCYRIRRNFQTTKFSKKLGGQQFRKQYFRKWRKGLASCHCCSVISKLYFRKHYTVFEIFVNFIIRKFLRIRYTNVQTY